MNLNRRICAGILIIQYPTDTSLKKAKLLIRESLPLKEVKIKEFNDGNKCVIVFLKYRITWGNKAELYKELFVDGSKPTKIYYN